MAKGVIQDRVRDAGVVGAGGAGFPTHVKLNASCDTVIANGAECEPLLRVDQQLMELEAERIVRGLSLAMEAVGAKRGVVATKSHYEGAVKALSAVIPKYEGVELHTMKSYYPAGDEKSLIYEVTHRVVPTGKLPSDVGVVVCNVNSLLNIAKAMDGEPVTHKFVTVTGAVKTPMTMEVPLGTCSGVLLKAAGAPADLSDYVLLIGGPCMGKISTSLTVPITKTTGGLVLFPKSSAYVMGRRQNPQSMLKMARSVCCQCSRCTQMCPRNSLGLNVQPHKAMRAMAQGNGKLIGDPNTVLGCCSCRLCTTFACEFGLDPSGVMAMLKDEFARQGIRPGPEAQIRPDPAHDLKRVPTERLIARLGLNEYNVSAPMTQAIEVKRVTLLLRQHIGAPSEPVVMEGQYVSTGDLVAMIPQGKLGANLHASIDGRVVRVSADSIELEA